MKNLNESMKEGETKKRQLEEALDALQEEVIFNYHISFSIFGKFRETLNYDKYKTIV